MRKAFLVCLILAAIHSSESSILPLSLIDIHAHIGSFRGFEIGEEVLLDNMRRFNVGFALVSNLDGANLNVAKNLDEIRANQITEHFVKQNRNRVLGLLWARPSDGSAKNLEPFLKDADRAFVGMKFHPEFNQFDADDPRVDPYLALCEKYQLVAVFHSGGPGSHSDPQKIYAIAKRHPAVPFVLYHMGFFASHNPAIQAAAHAKQNHDALLFLETAQVEPSAVLDAIKTLGSDFVLFGTDATYYGREHYAKYQKLLESLQKNLSAEDYRKVTSENATLLFHLESLRAGRSPHAN
jgi:predicted TIM-barrel fold metal-dependent hydrolase